VSTLGFPHWKGQSADHMAMSAQSAAPVGGSHPRHRAR
jgi:hypothetical protein